MSAADIKRSEIEKIVTEITTKAVLEEETEAFNELKLASEKFLKEIQTASYLSSTDDLITQMTTMQGKVSVFYSNMRNVYDHQKIEAICLSITSTKLSIDGYLFLFILANIL